MFARVQLAVVLAAVTLGPAPVDGQTISQNPRMYREWLRRDVDKCLAELYASTSELARLLEAQSLAEPREAIKHAERVVKRAHDAWSDVQLRKPTRERPRPDPAWRPRDLATARADALLARDLVREIATGIRRESRSRELDAGLRVSTLDKLERVELIGHRLRMDLASR